ncbi:MAG TPA: hypothetical protein PLR63_01930 [Paludibacteraceae bacterium]|nr:hypothetical protein [Paludibacteraceae bacterium]
MSFVKNQKVKTIRRETLLLLAYPFLRLVILFVRFYPKSHRAALGTFLGKLAYKFNKTSCKRTLNSLTIAYGDVLTLEKIEEMAKEVFQYCKNGGRFLCHCSYHRQKAIF